MHLSAGLAGTRGRRLMAQHVFAYGHARALLERREVVKILIQ
jgi:hypothetical protein